MSRATTATIDLSALGHNLQRARSAAPGCRIAAAVKADGYGHGLLRVAQALIDADALAVACIEEAVTLREGGITRPILLLEGVFEATELALCSRLNLDIVVHHPCQMEMLEQAPPPSPLGVWLKVDSGMHRLGLDPDQVAGIWQRLQAHPGVGEVRLMSHLANADDRADGYTRRQLETFLAATAGLGAVRSLANSAGVLGWPDTHLDWVRPGLMLYGASPFTDTLGSDEGLRPVMTLSTRLIAVKRLAAGEPVGYSCTWRCPEDMDVGVAAIGYGDGYPRHAPSGTPVLVNGRPAALIGRVSMDMLCVDLRHHPQARVGDPVVLWGEGLAVETIAQAAATIPYTLTCGITSRVRFVERE